MHLATIKGMEGTGAHTKYDMSYHVVFVPKKRRRIFGGRRSDYCEETFRQVAQELGCAFDTLKVALDHVHMLIMIPPKLSVATALQSLKSKTAHRMLKQFPELRRELPPGSFWARGYYVRSIGAMNEDRVRDYIARTDHF